MTNPDNPTLTPNKTNPPSAGVKTENSVAQPKLGLNEKPQASPGYVGGDADQPVPGVDMPAGQPLHPHMNSDAQNPAFSDVQKTQNGHPLNTSTNVKK